MKKKLFGALIVFMLMFIAVPETAGNYIGTVQTVEAAPKKKNTLVKKKGKLYYYDAKGKKVKNAWQKVKGKKYYFDKKGCAVTKKSYKIKNTYYVFDSQGQVIKPKKGKYVQVGKEKYYQVKLGKKEYYVNKKGKAIKGGVYSFKMDRLMYFKADGMYDGKTSGKLTSLVKKKKDWPALKTLLEKLGEKPVKTQNVESCHPLAFSEGGIDVMLTYKNFGISYFQGDKGNYEIYGTEVLKGYKMK